MLTAKSIRSRVSGHSPWLTLPLLALTAWSCGDSKTEGGGGTGGSNSGGSPGSGGASAGSGGSAMGTGGRGGGGGSAATGGSGGGTGGAAAGGSGGAAAGGSGGGGMGGRGGAGGGAVDAGGGSDASSNSASCPAGAPFPTLRQSPVAMGLSMPIHLVGHPGEPGTIFILERTGAVRVMRDGVLQQQPLFSVSTTTTSERGALSLALHPKFPENGRIWIFYTSPDSTVEEWKRMTPSSTTAMKVKDVYRFAHSAGNHQGGNLAFGPDGMLYWSLGDNANRATAEDPASRYGKVMRIDPDTAQPAAGNLNGFTWAYGLRNPWRMSFDRVTGDLYIADVGEGTQEEINFQPKGMGGRNYGWPGAEGNLGNGGVRPVHAYDRSVGKSVTGGYVYRGQKYPCLHGHYFYADYDSTTVRSFMVKDGVATDHRTHAGLAGNNGGGIYSFGEDGQGELYILRAGGRVTRIDIQ